MAENYLSIGSKIINNEITEVIKMRDHLNEELFNKACDLILNTKGKVILTGMGKSGHIASKIAATMASTGTPAFFVHPGEANHGDLGMFSYGDLVIAISHSGESSEIHVEICTLLYKTLKYHKVYATMRKNMVFRRCERSTYDEPVLRSDV